MIGTTAGSAPQAMAATVAESARRAAPRTTEGYGGFLTRTIAFAVDAAVIDLVGLIVAAVVALVFSLFPVSNDVHKVAVVAGGVLFVVWSIAYFVSFWTATGETPGNRAMRLRVVRADGTRLRVHHALLRIVGMLVSLPLLWGYVPILLNDRRRGVHDVMAGTIVLARPREADAEEIRPLARRRAPTRD